ncbi:MAG: monovalent cation/H+ antiporter complex subunit F [Desulfobacterales bacterium]
MITESILLKGATELTLVLLLMGILLAFIRLLIGPDPADRIVALDLISILIVAFLAAFSIYTGEKSFLDVAIAYALIAFLGTVALARFRERMVKKYGKDADR